MTLALLVVRLYPAAVRERWGADLEHQVVESGPGSWPNTVVGAAGLWLRPALWPETSAGQNRRRLAALAFAVTTLTALLMRATGTRFLGPSPHDLGRSAWLDLLLLGIVAAAPMPRRRPAALARLAVVSARTLGPPAFAVLAMFVAAHTGLVDHPTGALHAVLRGCYWLILFFAGTRVCALVAGTRDMATMPSIRRLRTAVTLIGSGLALAATQLVSAMARTKADTSGIITASALIILVSVMAATARDLRAGSGLTHPAQGTTPE